MSNHAQRRGAFRELIESGVTTVVPGAPNALTARLIEDVGFPAAYVTGAGVANTFLGVPDIGLLSLTEMAMHVAAIRRAVSTPLIVDADTGYGNAVNVWHTVRTLEDAGADAIQLEDQTFPKRCGHFDGKSTIPAAEMVGKIAAAADARSDPNLLLVARTDARAEHGITEACARGLTYHEAGADVIFVEAPETVAEIEQIAREIPGPKLLNYVDGGRTPRLPVEQLSELGFAIVLHANLPLVASIRAVRDVLQALRTGRAADEWPVIASWKERQRVVRKDFFDELGDRYTSEQLT